MGQQQSKDELLFQQVNYGNTEGIKALRNEGAGLEWIDREGKTPLIAACLNPELYIVAKTLIELGANVNAYRPGRHGGTPLHHAAKRGLEPTVKLLLSHGANALLMNDDCQTPLDVARVKGFSNVVRAIESHMCLFSGWLRELYGPGFLELLAPQLLSRKIWVVILPSGSRSMQRPFKLELAIYSSPQEAQPRTIVALSKANMEEPKFNHTDPTVIISDNHSIPRCWRQRRGILSSHKARCKPRRIRQTRIKLAAANENDKQQLQWFCNACKGIPQVTYPTFPFNHQAPHAVPATAPPAVEDVELAMAINASLQSDVQDKPPCLNSHLISEANASTSWTTPVDIANHNTSSSLVAPVPSKGNSSDSAVQDAGPSGSLSQHIQTQSHEVPVSASNPSAPPITDAVIDDGPVHYPSIDSTPVDISSSTIGTLPAKASEIKEDTGSSSCVICLDAPVEGACIPCGHMAGCMGCLNEIKAKKWGCPVCRAKIDQVIRLYSV